MLSCLGRRCNGRRPPSRANKSFRVHAAEVLRSMLGQLSERNHGEWDTCLGHFAMTRIVWGITCNYQSAFGTFGERNGSVGHFNRFLPNLVGGFIGWPPRRMGQRSDSAYLLNITKPIWMSVQQLSVRILFVDMCNGVWEQHTVKTDAQPRPQLHIMSEAALLTILHRLARMIWMVSLTCSGICRHDISSCLEGVFQPWVSLRRVSSRSVLWSFSRSLLICTVVCIRPCQSWLQTSPMSPQPLGFMKFAQNLQPSWQGLHVNHIVGQANKKEGLTREQPLFRPPCR